MVDEVGKFVQDVDYAPFGEASSKGAKPGDPKFTTEQWNGGDGLDALGLVQVGARIYDPVIGRFLSRDPLIVPRTASTTNPYSFAANDPINLSDPTGMDPPGEISGSTGSDSQSELQTIAALGAWAAEWAFTWGASPAPMFNTKAQWTTYYGAYISRSQQLQANHARWQEGQKTRAYALRLGVDPGPAFNWATFGSDTGSAIAAAIEVEKVNGTYEGDVVGAWGAEFKAMAELLPGIGTGMKVARGDTKGAAVSGFIDIFGLGSGRIFADAEAYALRFGESTVVDEGASFAGATGRGLSSAGGVFTTRINAAGGRVVTAVGDINGADVATQVNSALYSGGEIRVLTGVHGFPNGVMEAELAFLNSDMARFGSLPGVDVKNVLTMTAAEISAALRGTGTTIGAFCNSGACLKPFE